MPGKRKGGKGSNQDQAINVLDYFKFECDPNWTYVGIFYTMFVVKLLEMLRENDKLSFFVLRLCDTMNEILNTLIKTLKSDKEYVTRLISNDSYEGLRFTERAIKTKLTNSEQVENKIDYLTNTLNSLKKKFAYETKTAEGKTEYDEVFVKKVSTRIYNFICNEIKNYNRNAYKFNITFQVLLDSVYEDNEFYRPFMVKIYEGFKDLFGDNNPFINGDMRVTDASGIIYDYIYGLNKLWFGDCGEMNKCKEFNETVVNMLTSNLETIKKYCKLVNVDIEFFVSKFGRQNLSDKSLEVLKRYKIEDGVQLYTGRVEFKVKNKHTISPLSFYQFSKRKDESILINGNLRFGNCTSSTHLTDELWNYTYINAGGLRIIPCSILSNIKNMKGIEKSVPTAYPIIQQIVSKMKGCKPNSVKRMVNMARLVRYCNTGKLTGHFEVECVVKLIELITNTDRKTYGTIPKDDETIDEKANFFKKLWNTCLAKETEKEIDGKTIISTNVQCMKFPEKNCFTKTLRSYCNDQISPNLMCPYFSIPFTVKVKNVALTAGATAQFFKKCTNKITTKENTGTNESIDHQTGEVKDDNGEVKDGTEDFEEHVETQVEGNTEVSPIEKDQQQNMIGTPDSETVDIDGDLPQNDIAQNADDQDQ